jgi:ribosomal protein S18 acetylase RimI-like enzyme
MQIRNMTPDDYDDVYSLWLAIPGMGLNDEDDSRNGIEKFLHRNPNSCFVAVDGGAVVGAILCGHDGRRGLIYHAAVSPSARNRGIGTALVDCVTAALRGEGITKTALVVFSKNEIGNRFWENRGFTVRNDLHYRNKAIRETRRIDT